MKVKQTYFLLCFVEMCGNISTYLMCFKTGLKTLRNFPKLTVGSKTKGIITNALNI